MRKLVLFLFLIFLSSCVFASLDLTKSIYGPNSTFKGYLFVNNTDVSLDEIVKGNVKDCGNYSEKETNLYNILFNSSVYTGSIYSYEIDGSGFSSINFSGGEKNYAFQLDETIKNITFGITNNSGEIKIDIGADGYDYTYFGEFKQWGNFINSLDYQSEYSTYVPNYNNVETENPKIPKCSNFEIEFDESSKELLLRINAVAKRVTSGGELRANIGSKSCTFGTIGNSWTSVNCNITLDVSSETSPMNQTVCVGSYLDSNDGNFLIPEVPPSKKYYFISLNPAIYGNYASSLSINNVVLKNAVNNYINSECDGLCVVPIKLSGNGFVMNSSIVSIDGGTSNLVYNLKSIVNKINLTNKKIDLSYFIELRTPNKKDENCELKIEFLGKTYSDIFNVTDAPIVVLKTSSLLTGESMLVTFDGSYSAGDIVSWNWDFGDNKTSTGKIVQHSYSSEGEYKVVLTLKDSEDVESSDSVIIKVVNAEELLNSELSTKISQLENFISDYEDLDSVLKSFYSDKGYGILSNKSLNELKNISSEFDSVKNSSMSDSSKKTEYSNLLKDYILIVEKTPKKLTKLNNNLYYNYTLSSLSDIPTFSKLVGLTNLDDVKSEIYKFNQKNVRGDYSYSVINVDYLSGFDYFVYVNKKFKSSGGDLVDNLGDYGEVDIFTSGCNLENNSNVIYCSNVGSNFNLKYSALSDNIELNSGFIVPNSVYDIVDVTYQYDCSGYCDYSYCGDGFCDHYISLGIDEADKESDYYCSADCKSDVRKGLSWKWYLLSGVILLIVLWIGFYRGPGNFFSLVNGLGFKFFKKKSFLVDKDKLALKNYIMRALRQGFNEGEIRKALYKKGWNRKQLDYMFEGLKRKTI